MASKGNKKNLNICNSILKDAANSYAANNTTEIFGSKDILPDIFQKSPLQSSTHVKQHHPLYHFM